jgi:uncharacterized protein YbjQ (UPF0145 family)
MADDGTDDDVAGSCQQLPPRRSAWGSLLSVQDFAAIASAGFDPVGHVLGASVLHLGYVSQGGKCSGRGSYTSRTDLASATSGPFNLLLRKRYGARRQALSRAIEEWQALGADGIVGVTLAIRPFPAGGTEFALQGTAVRARSRIRPAAPFSSHLSAQDFVRLIQAGWAPTALVFGIGLGARHDDQRTRAQTRRTVNGEVKGYSNLVRDTRRDARQQLELAIAGQGADGVVVDEMTLHLGERECPAEEGMHDHVAEASILGTTIAAFGTSAAAASRAPLTIMHLNPAAGPGRGAVSPPPPPASPDAEVSFLDRLVLARSARRAARSISSSSDPAGITRKAD